MLSPTTELLVIDNPLTEAAVNVPPATFARERFDTVRPVKSSNAFTVVPIRLSVPPFSVNAPAPMLTPSASASPLATT